MGKALFTDKTPQFFSKNDSFIDMLLGHMSMDVETAIKVTAGTPVKTGNMKSMVRHFRARNGTFRVEADAEYSAVQEAGVRRTGKGAPTKKFERYSTPGTSAGWFMRAIDGVVRNKDNYIQEVTKALGL